MREPSSLIYVPEEYLDDKNIPLTLSSCTQSKYLSYKYSSQDWTQISKLGVVRLSDESFLEDLKAALQGDPDGLRRKPNKCHSILAKALLSLATKGNQHWNDISALEVIPLNDGNWVSAQSSKIYFSGGSDTFSEVPDGISIFVVDLNAEADLNRRDLFRYLGIQPYESSKICCLILDTHGNSQLGLKELSLGQLISHVTFLFGEMWTPPSNARFWFAVEDGRHFQGSEVYVDADPPSSLSASIFFTNSRQKYPFLHPHCMTAISEERRNEWITYLRKNFNISAQPRLVYPLLSSTFQISEDFEFVFKNGSSSMALQLLKGYWSHYSKWIVREGHEENGLDNSAKDRLRAALQKKKARCLNGQEYPLNMTFLPSADPSMAEFCRLLTMPILDIEDPKNEGWKCLEFLGVTVKKHVRLYLSYLEGMEKENWNVSPNMLSYIYEQIQSMYSDDDNFLRQGRNLH